MHPILTVRMRSIEENVRILIDQRFPSQQNVAEGEGNVAKSRSRN